MSRIKYSLGGNMNKDRKNRIDELNLTDEELMSLVNDHPDLLNLVDQKQYI